MTIPELIRTNPFLFQYPVIKNIIYEIVCKKAKQIPNPNPIWNTLTEKQYWKLNELSRIGFGYHKFIFELYINNINNLIVTMSNYQLIGLRSNIAQALYQIFNIDKLGSLFLFDKPLDLDPYEDTSIPYCEDTSSSCEDTSSSCEDTSEDNINLVEINKYEFFH